LTVLVIKDTLLEPENSPDSQSSDEGNNRQWVECEKGWIDDQGCSVVIERHGGHDEEMLDWFVVVERGWLGQ
jgi:hypothetical protein